VANQDQLLDKWLEAAQAARGHDVLEGGAMVRNEVLHGREDLNGATEVQWPELVPQRLICLAKGRRGWSQLPIDTTILERSVQIREGDDTEVTRQGDRLVLTNRREFQQTADQYREARAGGPEGSVGSSRDDLAHPPDRSRGEVRELVGLRLAKASFEARRLNGTETIQD
jgi:hypothetical protein